LIWLGEAKSSGALVPLNVTDVPASSVGSGVPCACIVVVARLDPKIDTNDPGEIGVAKDAELTTPAGSTWVNA
jgi:hypothetical protein